jgi:CRP/FNR family transcriptional regulator, anaerobic regulatory protein
MSATVSLAGFGQMPGFFGSCYPFSRDDLLRLSPPGGAFRMPAGRQLQAPEETGERVIGLLSGWAFSYRLFPEGLRQITTVELSGSLIGLNVGARDAAACGCETLTEVTYCLIPRDALMRQAGLQPTLGLRLAAESMRRELLIRERLADVARRSARERVANLLLELSCRAESRDSQNGMVVIPMTQNQIADAIGLTPIHVSRTLKDFKRAGIIRYVRRELVVADLAELRQVSTFEEHYVQWLRRPAAGRSQEAAPATGVAEALSQPAA